MTHTKEEQLAYLANEIGLVDDRFLMETIAYRSIKAPAWKIPTAIAASVLALAVSASVLFGTLRPTTGSQTESSGTPPQINEPLPPVTLDSVLAEGTKAPFGTIQSADAINYFGGVYLVWQTSESDVLYRSRELTNAETARLISLIDTGTRAGNSSPSNLCRVWILCGDGSVLTPYLPTTAGNVGASALFDYEAELIPSDALISCISDILKDQKGR